MNDPFGKPLTVTELKKKDKDVVRRLESMLYLIRVSEDDTADISECQLVTLPSEFYNLCRIFRKEIVNISRNQLTTLKIKGSENDLMKLDGIMKELNASNNLLREFPSGLLAVQSLVTLDLSGNQISEVPDAICKLCKLQELYLGGNLLASLPESICRLVELRLLDISSNRINRLPTSMSCMEKLEVLKVEEEDMEFPPSEICCRGVSAIKTYLTDGLLSPQDTFESSINGKVTLPDAVNIEKPVVMENSFGSAVKKSLLIRSEKEESEERAALAEKLAKEQKELDDLVLSAVIKRSNDLKFVFDEINELEERTSSLIQNSLRSFVHLDNDNKDLDVSYIEEVLQKRRTELEKEQREWLKTVDEESATLSSLVYFETDQRRKRSMDAIARRMDEMNLLSNIRTEEGQSNLSQICKEIAADHSLLEDFVMCVKEREDENTRNLTSEAENIARALTDITMLEMKKRDEQRSALVEKLKQERLRLLVLYDQVSAEKDFRRKQLFMDMKADMRKEEQAQKMIVADCLKRYAELIKPVSQDSAPVQQKKKLLKRLGSFSLLFGRKKKSEKVVEKVVPEKQKEKVIPEKQKENENGATVTSEPKPSSAISATNANGILVAHFSEECVVCLNNMVSILFFPCGHVCVCEKCSSAIRNCPLCRTDILRRVLLTMPW